MLKGWDAWGVVIVMLSIELKKENGSRDQFSNWKWNLVKT